MEYKKNSLEHLTIDFEVKNIIDEDPEFFQFTGYGSTFDNVDRGKDRISKGAFIDTLGKLKPKLLWQHKMTEPLGVFTEIYEDEKGLYIKGKMPKEDDFVRGRVIPQMKVGSINSMSIGFNADEIEDETIDGQRVRTIKKVTLWEVSLVTIPMNPEANIISAKSNDMTVRELENELKQVFSSKLSKQITACCKKAGFFDREDREPTDRDDLKAVSELLEKRIKLLKGE